MEGELSWWISSWKGRPGCGVGWMALRAGWCREGERSAFLSASNVPSSAVVAVFCSPHCRFAPFIRAFVLLMHVWCSIC